MMLAEKKIVIRNQSFILTNQRAMFWEESSALIFSDLHLGKTAHFRKNGIALPDNLIQNDLQRLSDLIHHFQPDQLIIVGDFLHAGKNSELDIFHTWKLQFPNLKMILVKGNHDRFSKSHFLKLGVDEIYATYEEDELIFSHEKLENQEKFVISGHLHPGVRVKTAVHRFLRFPSYIVTSQQLILPAFSSFTGLDTKNHPEKSQYFFFTEDGLYEI